MNNYIFSQIVSKWNRFTKMYVIFIRIHSFNTIDIIPTKLNNLLAFFTPNTILVKQFELKALSHALRKTQWNRLLRFKCVKYIKLEKIISTVF